MGTAAVADPALVDGVAARACRSPSASTTATASSPCTAGPRRAASRSPTALGRFPAAAAFVITDIARDGCSTGPTSTASRGARPRTDVPVIASGGVGIARRPAAPSPRSVGARPASSPARRSTRAASPSPRRSPRSATVACVSVARVIPCLDVTAGRVVKGVNFVDLRDAGDPVELAARYDAEGADELVFLDITASSDGRDTMVDVVRRDGRAGVHPVHRRRRHPHRRGRPADAAGRRRQGQRQHGGGRAARADRRDRRRVRRAVRRVRHRRQAARGRRRAGCEVYLHGGRTPTGLDAVEWAARGRRAAAPARSCSPRWTATARGEGFDLELTRAVADAVGVPVIASGGVGTLEHLVEGDRRGRRRRRAGGVDLPLRRAHASPRPRRCWPSRGITVRPVVTASATGDRERNRRTWSTAGSGGRVSRCRCCRSGRG